MVWTVTLRILTTSFAIFSRFCLWSSRFFKSLVKILTQSCKMKKKVLLRELSTFLVRILECFLDNRSRPDSLKKSTPSQLQRLSLSISMFGVTFINLHHQLKIVNSIISMQHCTTETYIYYIYILKKKLLSQDTGFWKKKKNSFLI